jgi:subtilisin family serine protease
METTMTCSPSRSRPCPRALLIERLEDRTLPAAGPPAPTLALPALHEDLAHADPSHLLVRFHPGVTPAALPGTSLGQALSLVPGLYEVDLSSGTTVAGALAAYRGDARVFTAEPDYLVTTSWTPNDPSFSQQWALRNTGQNAGTPGADIHAPAAWDVTIGNRRTVIAVIDSGIDYTHPDLYLNIYINQAEIPPTRRVNLIDVDRDGVITFRDLNSPVNQGPGKITDINHNGYIDAGDLLAPMQKDASGNDTGLGGWADGIAEDGDLAHLDDICGWNFVNDTNNPMDDFGHGTHVAGILGAVGNNGAGVAGVNWQVQLAPLKFIDSHGVGTVGAVIEGLQWAISKGIRISNNSWTDAGYEQILYDAVQRAQAAGHIFVAAAGNNSRNTDTAPVYPADFNLDNVVSVAASDRNDKLAAFSNWGPTSVAIAAPGVDVLSTLPGKSYGLQSGTSMATPQVAGVLAMVWSLRPEWTYRQVISWVLQTADRVPALAGKVVSGRLNAAAAVRVPPRTATTTVSAVQSTTLTRPPGAPAGGGGVITPSSVLAAGLSGAAGPTAALDQLFSAAPAPAGLGGLLGPLGGKKEKKDLLDEDWLP